MVERKGQARWVCKHLEEGGEQEKLGEKIPQKQNCLCGGAAAKETAVFAFFHAAFISALLGRLFQTPPERKEGAAVLG